MQDEITARGLIIVPLRGWKRLNILEQPSQGKNIMNIIFYTTVCIFDMVLSPFNTISCLFACFYVIFVLMLYCLLCLVLFLTMIDYR